MTQTLAQKVRARYGEAYADLSDQDLETAFLAKYPGSYHDLPRTPAAPPQDTAHVTSGPSPLAASRVVQDVLMGTLKGAGTTATNLGQLVHQIPGVSTAIDWLYGDPGLSARAFEETATALRPKTGGEQLGFGLERIGEFMVPAGMAAKATAGAGLLTRMGAQSAASGAAALAQTTDPAAAGGAAVLGAALPPLAGGIGRAGRSIQAAAAGAKEGGVGGAVAGALRMIAPGKPADLLTRALKPRSSQGHFLDVLRRAVPELKAVEATLERPIQTLDDVVVASHVAKQGIQQQLNVVRQGAGLAQLRLDPVAVAIRRAIPSTARLEQPALASRLDALGDLYRRPFSLQETETLLQETNAQLQAFYGKYPGVQRAALRGQPRIAVLEAKGRALRDTIYRHLDRPGGGEAARELNRRYGALMELEETARRRLLVAARQQPESLSEQIGAVRGAADMARGAWRIAHGDLRGAADIAAAHAGRATAKAIKQGQTTDALIRRAFQQVTERPAPVKLPPPRPTPLALPPGATPLGSPVVGTITVKAAKRMVQRNPKTGRMQRVYLGESEP